MSKQVVWNSGKRPAIQHDTEVVYAGCNVSGRIRAILKDQGYGRTLIYCIGHSSGVFKHTITHR